MVSLGQQRRGALAVTVARARSASASRQALRAIWKRNPSAAHMSLACSHRRGVRWVIEAAELRVQLGAIGRRLGRRGADQQGIEALRQFDDRRPRGVGLGVSLQSTGAQALIRPAPRHPSA